MENTAKSNRRKFSWSRRVVFSLLPVVILLLLLEGLLFLAGVRPVSETRDPYVGFASQAPLFEEAPGGSETRTMNTAPAKLVWFNPQSFSRIKPAGTTRIFCLGGSTTYGHPYSDSTSFVGWMRELLPVADEHTVWEVINAGGVSYASYRVAALMEELTQYQPDLFVIFSAHNEFLERRTYAGMFSQPPWFLDLQATAARTRTFALLDRWLLGKTRAAHPADILPAEVDELLNHTIGPTDYRRDPVWRSQVVQHYRINLQRMVALANAVGAKVVFVAPAANEKDCSPFKSDIRSDASESERAQIQDLLSRAHEAVAEHDYQLASELYRQALRFDSGMAEVHYQLGQSLFALKDYDAAHAAFRQAIEEDVCPLRAIEDLTVQLHEVSQAASVPIIEFDRLLTQLCQQRLGHKCLGNELFLDHVHPNIEVHRELAVWIIEALQQANIVTGRNLRDPEQQPMVQAVIRRVEGAIDQQQHGVALRNLAKLLHWSGKFAEAAPRASDALELLPRDAESRFVLADCLKNIGDPEGAVRQYELLFEDSPNYVRGWLPYGELLVQQELWQRAKSQLLLAVLREPENAYALYLLGIAHLRLGEYAFAVECFEKADQIYPGEPRTLAYLSEARANL